MESTVNHGTIYEFDGFRLVPDEQLLIRNGEPIALNIKSFGVLRMLVERHGHLVSKSELIDTVWEDAFVEEGSLSKAVWTIRHALGDTSKERFIQTVPRRGYRFIAPVSIVTTGSGAFRLPELIEHAEPVTEPTSGHEKSKVVAPVYARSSETVPGGPPPNRPNYKFIAGCVAVAVLIATIGWYGIGRAEITRRGTQNEEAFLAYTHAMYLLDRQPSRTEEDEKSPLEYLDTAVRLDPNYAKAWAAKAFAHYAAMPVPVRDSEHYRKAHEALDKALSLDPNEPLAHAALCHQRLFDDWNYSGAEEAGLRAIELDPGSSFAHSEYAVVLTSRERFAEAFDHLRKAMETDPTSFRILAYYANTLFMARRYREAEEQYRNLIDLKPDREATYSWLIRIAEVQGKEAEAFEWTVKDMIALGKGEEAVQRYKTAYETSGYRGAVLERINQKIMPVHGYVYLGDKDNAFAAMEENYKKRNYYLGVFGMVDPTYDSLRSDPRWADMVRRIKNN